MKAASCNKSEAVLLLIQRRAALNILDEVTSASETGPPSPMHSSYNALNRTESRRYIWPQLGVTITS